MLVKLEEIATYINGKAFKPSEWVESGLPIIRIQNLNNPSKEFNYYDKEVDEKYIIKNGDILISWSATLDIFEWKREKALLNQHIFKVVFDKDIEIDKSYFKLAISSVLHTMEKYTHGSTMKHIVKKDFENIQIPLPALENQKAIAKKLDKAKELIELRKASIKKLDELSKAVFVDMFGDPVENPKNFPIVELSKLLTDKASNGYFGSKTDYSKEGTPTIWIGDFIDKYNINIDTLKRVNIPIKKKEKYLLKYGDILFCRSSLTKEGIAKVGFIQKDINCEVIFEDHVIKVPIEINKILPEYFYYYSYDQFYRLWMYKMSKTATMTTIGQKEILKSPVLVPPIELQEKFAKTIQKIEAQKALYEEALEKLEYGFEALLSESFG